MATVYTTRNGDMLDLICYRHYDGKQAGAVEAVLEANRVLGLSERGPVLPMNVKIVLPDLPDTSSLSQSQPLQKLWD